MATIRYTTPDQGTQLRAARRGGVAGVSVVRRDGPAAARGWTASHASASAQRFSARLDEAIEISNVEADAASARQHAAAHETAAGEPVEDIKRYAQVPCSASAVEEPR